MKPLSSKKTIGLPRRWAPFLSAANPVSATAGWPRRLLLGPVVRAFGRSSPNRGASSQRDPGDASPGTPWRSPRPPAGRSRGRRSIRPSAVRPRESRSVAASASRRDGASRPPFSKARRHRLTEDSEAPTISATSSTSLPSSSNCPASRRRACSSAALPFGLIP
jgi:hypothetical protein